jgi:hypothetical protein
MKQIFVLLAAAALFTLTACEKEDDFKNSPRTSVPSELQGLWMHGQFSTTEYWSTDPATYMGNGFEVAFAFHFNGDGTYTQYFTSSSVVGGGVTYQQSVTKGTVEVDPVAHTIKTHALTSRYKRTRNGQTVEERDLTKKEARGTTKYDYDTGMENGTEAIYLTLQGTTEPRTFLKN